MAVVGKARVIVSQLGENRSYELVATYPSGDVSTAQDAYRFWPTVGDLDLYLFGQGRHEHLWHMLGAHLRRHEGAEVSRLRCGRLMRVLFV